MHGLSERREGTFEMSEKKVIAVIVEGPSEEAALGPILKKYFASEEVQFAVVHGDITLCDNVTTDTIISKVGNLIESVKTRYGYRTEDFLKIIHIVDTDGAFIQDAVVEADVEKITYYTDRIETSRVEAVKQRNERKAQVLTKLYMTGKVRDIRYSLYFNSCNLEHVLYNELKAFTDEEKEYLSDSFADMYEDNVKAFVAFISDPSLAVPGTYKQTWRFIEKSKNSLNRYTNMNLIFSK